MKRLAAALLVLAACDRHEPPKPSDAAAPRVAVDAAPLVDATRPVDPTPTVDACGAELPIRSAKSIGHTSVVYKLTLADGRKLAWKPNAKKVRSRWRGEVAAYRLGLALGIPNVPPACPRVFSSTAVTALVGEPAFLELIAPGDGVEGAVIPWIEGLQFLPLDKDPLRTQAHDWLSAAVPLPADKAALAAQISTLVVFDAVTGNWDRYSGGNVGLDASGKTVLFIDNDAAFMDGPPPESLRQALRRLDATDRYSRSVVAKLRALDEATLATIFGSTAAGAPLLPSAMVGVVATRIRGVLETVNTKIAARSEADVLVFP